VVSIVVVLLAGVFADAWEDNHAIPCLYIGATFAVWLSAQSHVLSPAASKVSSLKGPRWFRVSHFRNPLHARLNFNTHPSRDMMVTE
jgi:hypothetical protein